MLRQKYIIFEITVYDDRSMRPVRNEQREITVFEGQSYYKSTGHNSGFPDLWIPFLMLKGEKPFVRIPSQSIYNCEELESTKNNLDYPYTYIIKLDPAYLKNHDNFEDKYANKFPTKTTRLTSCRLHEGRGKTNTLATTITEPTYTKEEIALSKKPILFEEKPDNIFRDPDLINQWLAKQGAIIVKTFFNIQFSPETKTDNPAQPLLGSQKKPKRCCFFRCCYGEKETDIKTAPPMSSPPAQQAMI